MADDRRRDEWDDWDERRDPDFREWPWRGEYPRRGEGPPFEEWPGPPDRGPERSGAGRRPWWERAHDEMRSWLGDPEANRRRAMDSYRTWQSDPDYASVRSPTGRGPRGYKRLDSRILEDVSDRLGYDWDVDATDIEVTVKDGVVTLDGTVDSRRARRRAEYLAAEVWGVRDVQNNLRVRERTWQSGNLTGSSSAALEQTTGVSSGTPVTGTKPPTH